MNRLLSKEQATETVHAILQGTTEDAELVPFNQFKSHAKLRSKRYESFHVLCFKNTHKSTGWLVCQYILSKGCKLSSGILSFRTTNGGTGRLERHAKQHEASQNPQLTLPRSVATFSKSAISRAAALTVAYDLRPLSFTENKLGMRKFVEAVFKAGQQFPVNDCVNPDTILPSAKTVTESLKTVAFQTREEYRHLILEKMYETGGAVTTDGVTLKVLDKQFLDLTIHFIEVTESGRIDVVPKVEMKVATLLLKEKPAVGDAMAIRGMLGTYLKSDYGKEIDWLTKRFTMVTDCASVMARVALSSVSARIALMDEKWMGCFAHQINTAMRCCINALADDQNPELQQIFEDLQNVKKIVPIFKQSGWNGTLPNGFHLVQECETRFGTTLTVVQRFLKSADHVKHIIAAKDSSTAKAALASISEDGTLSGVCRMPALEAVADAFQIVVDAQTNVQAAKTPTIHIALPLLQSCRDELERIADGGSIWPEEEKEFIPSTRFARKLCRSLLDWLEAKVRVHDLWLVGCFVHPYLREFQFISNIGKRAEFKVRAESLLRALIKTYTNDTNEEDGSQQQSGVMHVTEPLSTQTSPTTVVGRK